MSDGKVIRPNSGLGPSRIAAIGAPISFTAKVTGLTPGITGVFDTGALQPGYRIPYFIDGITMALKSPVVTYNIVTLAGLEVGTGFGSLVDFQFQTGHHAFSNNHIAAPLYCQRYMYYIPEEQFQTLSFAGNVRSGQYYCVYRWLFPKPLLLLPGDVIQASCKRQLSIGAAASNNINGAMTATVTYTGRACPPGFKLPKTTCVPWVGAFMNDNVGASPAVDLLWANTNREFENPFQRDWHVQKLVARTLYASSTEISNDPADTNVPLWDIKITDPLGYAVTNGYVPVSSIANFNDTSAWTFSRPVGPRQRVNMEFNYDTQSLSTGEGSRRMVSLVGYREENL